MLLKVAGLMLIAWLLGIVGLYTWEPSFTYCYSWA